MKTKSTIQVLVCLVLMFVLASAAHATSVTITSGALNSSDPTQFGRLFRGGTPADWSTTEPYQGLTATGNQYHYRTYSFWNSADFGDFFEISFLDNTAGNAVYFASAFIDSYNPLNPGATYLGDAGATGNYFTFGPRYFQVIVPKGHKLVIMIEDTIVANGGLGIPFTLNVDEFLDSGYSEATVPEPSTLALIGPGVAGLLGFLRKRRLA